MIEYRDTSVKSAHNKFGGRMLVVWRGVGLGIDCWNERRVEWSVAKGSKNEKNENSVRTAKIDTFWSEGKGLVKIK